MTNDNETGCRGGTHLDRSTSVLRRRRDMPDRRAPARQVPPGRRHVGTVVPSIETIAQDATVHGKRTFGQARIGRRFEHGW